MRMSKLNVQFVLSLWCVLPITALAADPQSSDMNVKAAPTLIRTTPLRVNANQSPKSKQDLISEKQVSQWPGKGHLTVRPTQIVHLTPQECNVLGGKISFFGKCDSGVLCIVGSHALCVDRMQE